MTTTTLISDSRDYELILKSGLPLLDVRAPIEFAQGAFAQATNLPLMQDSEREIVGTCYKQSGQQAAIASGHALVHGEVRAARIAAWKAWVQAHPQGYLCCARGGLRSHTAQQWLREANIDCPLVAGGYRALRQHALARLHALIELPMVIVGGNTGCGKTTLIENLANGIDLEGLARHRGSSFGRTLQNQPAQATFEHDLALAFIRRAETLTGLHWVLEDEGAMIGSCHLPEALRARMSVSPVVVIDDPFELRLSRLRHDYFEQMLSAFLQQADNAELGWQAFDEYLHHGLFAIRRRLGMARFTELRQHLTASLRLHRQSGDAQAHYAWLVPLLNEYYDPMYRYQLEKKQARIVYRGDSRQVMEWLANRSTTTAG